MNAGEQERASSNVLVKPQPDRLYGRQHGHCLRPRQKKLLEETLPRIRLSLDQIGHVVSLFDQKPQQIWFEVGFGGGEHVLGQMQAHPNVGYIASEVFRDGICSLLSRLVPVGGEATGVIPAMLRLWDEDARQVLRVLPEAVLDKAFLMFPDPWPKARHAKRRFIHPQNITLMARVLKSGGIWHVASDDPVYQNWVQEVMAHQPYFEVSKPQTVRPSEGWVPTRYEAKALAAGRQPLYWTFIRR
ncbi:MAG: tRNA (guanosine(46)-N7)-methyltransferase TrmB [Acetobacter sp.]|nr:tRNA (guanosine(46)-N7)-methyltransferase TrmB [Acetobacter sp.]